MFRTCLSILRFPTAFTLVLWFSEENQLVPTYLMLACTKKINLKMRFLIPCSQVSVALSPNSRLFVACELAALID